MNKLDSFKRFVKTKPHLAYKVHSGLTTWQKLYEIYDVYGPNHDIFDDGTKNLEREVRNKEVNLNTNEEANAGTWREGFTSILKALQDIDIDKLSDNLNSLKNIFSIFERPKTPPVTPKRPYRRFED